MERLRSPAFGNYDYGVDWPIDEPESRPNVDRNKQEYDDLTTQFSEMLDGAVRTTFEFSYDGQDFYDRGGRALGPVFNKGLEDAERVAAIKSNLGFEVRRRQHDKDEYADQLGMARGEKPNTMVVVGDFPEELKSQTSDVGGYNVRRRQTMLRILAWDGRTMKLHTQSLDGSDRGALEAIYHQFGYQPQPGELLGQRINIDMSPEDQDKLTDHLKGVYDDTLAQNYGGTWKAGIAQGGDINTYDFVEQQRDIVQDAMIKQKHGCLDVYATAALLNKRLEEHKQMQPGAIKTTWLSPFQNSQGQTLQQELAQAAAEARARGQVFSACGGTVGPNGELSVEEKLGVAGYGNQTDQETTYEFKDKRFCRKCQDPPKDGDHKKLCGPCGFCRSCDVKLGGKG